MTSIEPPPSRLGTKEHWDDVYSSELVNFKEIGDEGEIWFGEDTVEKTVDWVLDNVPRGPDASPFILEIGAGNGNLLFALYDAGYRADRMCGIDYSADAVKLARAIAQSRHAQDERNADEKNTAKGNDVGTEAITFDVCDFLRDNVPVLDTMLPPVDGQGGQWDLVLDKGTFDAMALADKDDEDVAPADGYPSRIARVVKLGGYFLITSCNFTEEELKAKFITAGTGFVYQYVASFYPRRASD
ncbi:hypothetical protein AcV5_008658 [Taiwanofungus camphoratus]|nr:hypothetical protein AcV5_008658 [Antrodia cinnamomea]KAI0956192.1 hypothetical protein AcV7_006653 [Antrodia cinnamomea]